MAGYGNNMINSPLNIVGDYQKNYVTEISPAETLNMYVTSIDEKTVLLPRAGLSSNDGKILESNGNIRCLFEYNDILHAIAGEDIFQLNDKLVPTWVKKINTSSSNIQIVANEYQMFFVDGVNGYYYEPSTNLYKTIPTLINPVGATILAGYFVTGQRGTSKFYYSKINDCSSWDILDFNKITSYPDTIINLLSVSGLLYIFGGICVEVWQATGNANTPFMRNLNMVLDYGCAAAQSVAKEGETFTFLATSKDGDVNVVSNTGGEFKKISNLSVEIEFQSYNSLEDATGFMYTLNGQLFYHLNFTVENTSWLYNFSNGTWSKLTYKSTERHRANNHVFFNNKHYVGDYGLPIIYALDSNSMDDAGVAIRKRRITPIYHLNNSFYFYVDTIKILVSRGYGTAYGKDKDPNISLRVSRDGGRTYGGELMRSLSKLGRTTNWEVIFDNFGVMDSLTLEITCDNDINFVLMNAFVTTRNVS
jgi:hypothetical protein